MDRRLEQLYNLIPVNGRGVIDVGTDHGQIPISLARSQYTGNIYASDIVTGPLNIAREAARATKTEGRIHFMLCDGLELCPAESVDTIIIAGMGGDTICGILDRVDWIFSGQYKLILQPMTRAEVLRYWLVHNEFLIDKEAVIVDDSHVYQIFTASNGKSPKYSDAEYLVGRCSIPRLGDAIGHVISHQLLMIQKKLSGIQKAGRDDSSEYAFFASIAYELTEMNTIFGDKNGKR